MTTPKINIEDRAPCWIPLWIFLHFAFKYW
jgi:hypothetical protein